MTKEKSNILFKVLSFDNVFHPFPGSLDSEESPYSAEDPGSIPGSGGSSGEGNGNPLQYSCLENSMDMMGSQRVGHD